MRAQADVVDTIDRYGDTVWRVCALYFGSSPDAQDAFQETLLRYTNSALVFNEEEHRKAWLIRVATNVCKDMLKAAHRKTLSLDDEQGQGARALSVAETRESSEETVREVLEAMRALSDPPRTPVYLALYEGYTAPEIAKMLDAPVNTVYSWIARGKETLREALR